ncbi:nucleotidyltransferase domain-containing protein [Paenibacillus sp. P26]|nr:nucleotidyltransferase domain-containing protein [Paenibacillus sp. P26]UUZ90497.1 nucleotidyltransferase domain-containing protein [Paenibacillus sp. P25]
MSDERLSAFEAAVRFIELHYPACEGAILAGSIVIGRATPSSDLDIVIFDESAGFPYRRTYREFGWVIEAFVLTRESYRYFFDQGIDSAIPSLQRMCSDGVLLRGQGVIEDIVDEARQEWLAGPPAWSREEIDKARYGITETLDDLKGSTKRAECLFIVHKLTSLLSEFLLRVNGQWLGDGKWMSRGLHAWNTSLASRLEEALEAFYRREDRNELARFAAEVLSPYGGFLTEGYTEGILDSAGDGD